MHISKVLMALAAATLLMTGCAKQKQEATKALDAVEASLQDFKADAQKYAPDGLKGIETNIKMMQDSLEKKEYENVLAGTPQLEKAVASLKEAVASGKEHAEAALVSAKTEWTALNVDVPKMVEAIEARVAELDKRKVRIKLSKEEVESAKSGLAWMKSEWAEATAAATSGKEIEAAEKGKAIRQKGEELQKQLDIKTA